MTEIEQRISTGPTTIRADRACVGCGFNLIGQVVSKEPHYDLAIVRCPECATVAALQSYPTMSHWVNRFRALIAGIWILVMIGFFVVQITSIVSYAETLSGDIGVPLAMEIGESYQTWANENEVATGINSWIGREKIYYQWVSVLPNWAEENLDSVIEEFGMIRSLDLLSFLHFAPGALVAFILGVLWCVFLLGTSRPKVALVPLIAACIAYVWTISTMSMGVLSWQSIELARQAYLPWIIALIVVIEFPFMILGIFFGRKIGRGIVMMTLPPRSRIPLSILWTRDGLEPPRPIYK